MKPWSSFGVEVLIPSSPSTVGVRGSGVGEAVSEPLGVGVLVVVSRNGCVLVGWVKILVDVGVFDGMKTVLVGGAGVDVIVEVFVLEGINVLVGVLVLVCVWVLVAVAVDVGVEVRAGIVMVPLLTEVAIKVPDVSANVTGTTSIPVVLPWLPTASNVMFASVAAPFTPVVESKVKRTVSGFERSLS